MAVGFALLDFWVVPSAAKASESWCLASTRHARRHVGFVGERWENSGGCLKFTQGDELKTELFYRAKEMNDFQYNESHQERNATKEHIQ